MSEAPERIWATVAGLRTGIPGAHWWLIGGWEARAKQSDRETEYVRKDLFDAVKAERDNYKALYEAERDDELLNIARQAGHQDGAEDRRKLEARVKALTEALLPIANMAARYDPEDDSGDYECWSGLAVPKIYHLRAARAALRALAEVKP